MFVQRNRGSNAPRLTAVSVKPGLRRSALGLVAFVGTSLLLWRLFQDRAPDLTVYLAGADALLEGKPLYDSVAVQAGPLVLPFTYPPFAAVLMIPFALLPFSVTVMIWAVLSLLSLVGIAYVIAKRLPALAGVTPTGWTTWDIALAIYAVSSISEPVLQNFDVGQVNLFIVLAVLYDTVSRTHYRGFLTGLAAGLKVTPGLFMIYMLVTRRWGDFGRSLLGFGTTLVIGSFYGIDNVWRFWTHELFATDRVGDAHRYSNLGLNGVLIRAMPDEAAKIVWAVLAVIAVVGIVWIASVWWTRSRLVAASLVGMATVLVSPISWPHHWIWLIPAIGSAIALAIRAFRTQHSGIGWLLVVACAATLLPALLQLRFYWLERVIADGWPGAKAIGAVYSVVGVLIVVALAVSVRLFPKGESANNDDSDRLEAA